MTNAARNLLCLLLLTGAVAAGACASAPPPPPAEVVPVHANEPLAPTMAETPDAGAPAESATQAQAQTECQAADDCKSRGEPATGQQWTCEGGRCVEQAATAPATAEAPPAPQAADDGLKSTKKKAKGKKK